ncbi:DUF2550 domain-containing protein [Brevibacterium otitidis]|uniref:DUF2550 domain-containing protein n=1 Tax=Brevibacterium otitidis TaxID=53364 RepID=A0ABV5X5H5_9MICO|nr:DUF2550 domain-containing protein [Brevibacterium otitidis]
MNPSTLLIILLSLVGLAVVLVVLFLVRRRAIAKLQGAFDCSISVGEDTPRPRWRLGVAVFTVTSLDWFPIFSLTRGPTMTLPRQDMEIVSRAEPDSAEQYAVMPGAVIVTAAYTAADGSCHETRLALDYEALAALASWLESAPPGFNRTVGRFT